MEIILFKIYILKMSKEVCKYRREFMYRFKEILFNKIGNLVLWEKNVLLNK